MLLFRTPTGPTGPGRMPQGRTVWIASKSICLPSQASLVNVSSDQDDPPPSLRPHTLSSLRLSPNTAGALEDISTEERRELRDRRARLASSSEQRTLWGM